MFSLLLTFLVPFSESRTNFIKFRTNLSVFDLTWGWGWGPPGRLRFSRPARNKWAWGRTSSVLASQYSSFHCTKLEVQLTTPSGPRNYTVRNYTILQKKSHDTSRVQYSVPEVVWHPAPQGGVEELVEPLFPVGGLLGGGDAGPAGQPHLHTGEWTR